MNLKLNLTALTTANEEMPLIKELAVYFFETYMRPDQVYENLNLEPSSLLTLSIIILGMCLGCILAGFGAVFNKQVLGKPVRKLLSLEALSPETAVTLEQMGMELSLFTRLAVKKSVSLKRVIKCVEEERFEREAQKTREEYDERRKKDRSLKKFKEVPFNTDILACHFYIPEAMRYSAEFKFEKKGSTWLGAVIFTFVMIAVAIAILVFLPDILELLNDFVGSFQRSPSNIL